mgnify:CR=1 FL=1
MSDYNQLFVTLYDCNFGDKLLQNTAVYAPITFEEIVMIVIVLSKKQKILNSSMFFIIIKIRYCLNLYIKLI